jgi:glycosyltransferase involved in cell wall biosynthesis
MTSHSLRRILFCTDTYPPQLNGVSVVTAISVQGLADRGWRCAVVAPRYPAGAGTAETLRRTGAETELLSVPSASLPVYPDVRLSLPSPRAVGRLMDEFRPDLVHCATEFVLGRMGQIAAARRGIPVVSSYHTDFSRYAAAYGWPRIAPAISRYIGRFHRRSARVYTPSGPARDDLHAMGVSEVEVWGRGVDTEIFHPRRRSPDLRQSFGMGSRFTFLHVGRFAAEKNVEVVLEAYAIASESLPRGVMHLVIAGAGPLERTLRAVSPRGVSFLGQLDRRSVLPDLYANADAFVFASLTETLGLVVLEAMASGLPVLAAPAGGVADHLRDGVNGITCEPGSAESLAQAMIRMVESPMEALRLRQGARRTAEQLTWDAELDRLDVSYTEVLLHHSPHPTPRFPLVRQPASHDGPVTQCALGRDPAAMALHQVPHDRQPESRAALFPGS